MTQNSKIKKLICGYSKFMQNSYCAKSGGAESRTGEFVGQDI